MFKTLLFCALLSSFAFGKAQFLASMDNQEDRSIVKLYALTDENEDVVEVEVRRFLEDKLTERESVACDSLRDGLDLGKAGHRSIVRIHSRNFSSHQGGEVTFSYLHNGITGSRRALTFDLARRGDVWELTHNRRVVKKIHVISKRFFGRTVGIQRVTFTYKN